MKRHVKTLKIKEFCFALTVLLFTVLLCVPAQAAMVSYFLDQNNVGLPDANYAKVTISENGQNIDFMVEVLSDAFPVEGPNFGMQKFYFNFDGSPSVTAANIIITDPTSWSVNTNKNAGGGFGKFDFELKGCGNSRVRTLLFTIMNVSGDMPGDYATGNLDGNPPASEFFAAHIADFSGFSSRAKSAKFAGSTVVPIPGSVVLLGSGLLGVIFLRRKRSVK